jgi:hypothetical protein
VTCRDIAAGPTRPAAAGTPTTAPSVSPAGCARGRPGRSPGRRAVRPPIEGPARTGGGRSGWPSRRASDRPVGQPPRPRSSPGFGPVRAGPTPRAGAMQSTGSSSTGANASGRSASAATIARTSRDSPSGGLADAGPPGRRASLGHPIVTEQKTTNFGVTVVQNRYRNRWLSRATKPLRRVREILRDFDSR